MPKISIIVPVYNTEQYLHRCIDSILTQTFTDLELLLIDDGSKDSSGKICDEYAAKDSRVRVFHKENSGVSSARNLGLDNAKGEWISFVDSDDYIDKEFIPKKFPDADFVLQGWMNATTNNCDEYFSSAIYEGKTQITAFINEYIDTIHLRSPWGKFFRKDVIKQNTIRFNENFTLGEDTIFVMEYLAHIESCTILGTSYYQHHPNDSPTKYPQEIKTALHYLKTFWETYQTLRINDMGLLSERYRVFKACTINRTKWNKVRWYTNRYVFLYIKEIYIKRFPMKRVLHIVADKIKK